jgi:hypothetical protein
MYSEVENKVIQSLQKEFGMIYEENEEHIVMEKVRIARHFYEKATDDFRVNQSAQNYNNLIIAMVSLQYWNQKKVRLFSIREDF